MDAAFVMLSSLWNYDSALITTGLEQIALFP